MSDGEEGRATSSFQVSSTATDKITDTGMRHLDLMNMSQATSAQKSFKLNQGPLSLELWKRRLFSQLFFLGCLFCFCLMSFSTYFHRQRNNLWKNSVKNISGLPKHEHATPSPNLSIKDRGIWTVNSVGRLGNQMGEYATLYGLAKLNGYQAYILPGMHRQLATIFRITLPMISSEMLGKIPWRNYNVHDWMSEEYHHIQGKYMWLRGTPCSYTFYHHLRHEILQEFTFHDYIKEDVNRNLLQLRGQRKSITYIGVHVRRGDYVHVMPQRWKGVIADKNYLDKAMSYFREKYHDAVFVVASNGMAWCKENINASTGDVYFAGDGRESSPVRDFALLAHCNHTIMTIGTFGIWAAYLAGGETIYLANYTLPDSPFLRVFKPSAAFLPEWIGIPADLSPLLPKS